ncbi:hypothetical protein MBLNU459_g0664t1 [Dothideomycetes sp. NU459]
MLNEIPIEDQYVFTSLRFDASMKRNSQNPTCCPESKTAYLIKYHYDRLITAAEHMGWYHTTKVLKTPTDLFNRISRAVDTHKRKTGNKCPFKVRVCLRHSGVIDIGVEPILAPPKPPLLFPTTLELGRQQAEVASRKTIFKVVLDVLPTRSSMYTRDKTYYRSMYDYARQCAQIQSYQDAKEVLLFNKDNHIMDGSITTPYFYRGGKWVTPHADCGGQQGTTRRWALDQGLCVAGTIHMKSLRHDEIIWLSNGVKGFFTARVICSNGCVRKPSYDSRSTSCSSSEMMQDAQTPEEYNDLIEGPHRKHPVDPDNEEFRNTAFNLDLFDRSMKL